jgi:acyl transferase domain-containing protein/NAD(P)-dependent dehydrogenase (short-subunit alcohol dehydrogenase family)
MKTQTSSQTPIAIIGIGCIFAKSPNLKGYLRLLMGGISGITDPPNTHQQLNDCFHPDPRKPDHIYCNRGGFLPPIKFDPTEFGIPPNNLEATDTSQLLGLLVAKEALNDAGYGADGKAMDRDRCSIILGVTGTQELVIPLGARLGHPTWRRALEQSGISTEKTDEVIQRISGSMVEWQENSFPGLLGNVVAGRIANRLDLGGTNCVVDAACASSMGAIRMAVLELSSGHSDMVITGGVDTINDAFMHMCFSKTQILSPSGDIRPFSAEADGTVLGEGIGLIVLKRLKDAERDNDRIYAVIKGIGSSSDGKSQSIYAPRPEGQASALRRAYKQAETDPALVELMEAHGTGTRVGDQVEFKTLCNVFNQPASKTAPIALGSVKSNIGHTKATAGTAGLIKGALALYHKMIPPTLKAETPDPKLDLRNSRFYINTKLRPWIKSDQNKRIAGVSAFGFGGSNFHAVLEEYTPRRLEPAWTGQVDIIAFSGPDRQALEHHLKLWNSDLEASDDFDVLAAKALKSREWFNPKDNCRLVMVFDQWGDIEKVKKRSDHVAEKFGHWKSETPYLAGNSFFFGQGPPDGPIAGIFPGQGSQYAGMGRDLVCCFPESLDAVQEAEHFFSGEAPLSHYLYPTGHYTNDEGDAGLRPTQITQPAIGAVSVAMLESLNRFGVRLEATCGHSYGELVALYAAGWIERQDLWKLSCERGRLMADAGKNQSENGTMLAVKAPIEELEAMVTEMLPDVVLANLNSPTQGVLSGTRKGLRRAEHLCVQKGWRTIELPVSAAFHSHLVGDAQKPFQEMVESISFSPSSIQVMSNTTGMSYPSTASDARKLLGGQLANPVQFIKNIRQLYASGIRTFIEIGPKAILTPLVKAILDGHGIHVLSLDRSTGRNSGLADLANLVGALAALGHPIRLEQWEQTVTIKPPARMAIELSGANYIDPKRKADPLPQKAVSISQPKAASGSGNHSIVNVGTAPSKKDTMAVPKPSDIASVGQFDNHRSTSNLPIGDLKNMDHSQKQNLQAALSAVQQGLSSITDLQHQTAQAHQKFLDTQNQAAQTLMQIMHQAQYLASTALGIPASDKPLPEPSYPVAAQRRIDNPSIIPETPFSPSVASVRIESRQAAHVPNMPPSASASIPAPVENQINSAAEIKAILVGIVSELTGYPEEMLGMDMDIESDLGIDSIKRVEILSALEEKKPDLPKVTPDMMGSLKTLGQICDYLTSVPDAGSGQIHQPVSPEPLVNATQVNSQPPEQHHIEKTLVGIVSELTGYPEEMLGMDMDIESDLGIDSIKRVEILSALEEKEPELPKVTPDLMGSLKTLGQICAYLAGGATGDLDAAYSPMQATPQKEKPQKIPRQIVRIQAKSKPDTTPMTAEAAPPVGVVCPESDLADALAEAFANYGFTAVQMSHPDELAAHQSLSGVLIAAPVSPVAAFEWAQRSKPVISNSDTVHSAFFCTISFIDGAFGFKGQKMEDPKQGALAGLVKTAALEWPDIRCTAIDIDPEWNDRQAVARAVISEVVAADPDRPTEVGISGPDADERIVLELVDADREAEGDIGLGKDDVMVVIGGARGVTAASASRLAQQTGCKLALIGRSPSPTPEPAWLSGLMEEAEIKRAILAHSEKGSATSPMEIESEFKRWTTNREIQETLTLLTDNHIETKYYSVDVCDSQAVSTCLQAIRASLGPVKGVIYGAGVLEDRFIVDKQIEQFQRVFDTKVIGLESILAAIEKDELDYLVCFSSVVARVGNSGQADYAMANEVLNKMARQYQLTHPACKVISINWGPWDGGMVTPMLKRNFAKSHVDLIPIHSGAQAMLDEMVTSTKGNVEVVIGTAIKQGHEENPTKVSTKADLPISSNGNFRLAVKRNIDIETYPILRSHLLNGRPVVPLALIAEWLAHSALHQNPGLLLKGINDLRLLNGITLDGQRQHSVHMMTGKTKRVGSDYEVDVEIRNGAGDSRLTVHSSAKAILADRLPTAPKFSENGHFKGHSLSLPISEAYERILFHGEDLRGIQDVIGISDRGMAAKIASAPSPDSWIRNPLRSRWISDPMILDCAFQMAILWCHDQYNCVSLPSFASAYRQYCNQFPSTGVTAVLQVRDASPKKMIGDFTFLDENLQVVAELRGYEAIMDQDLIHKFHPN